MRRHRENQAPQSHAQCNLTDIPFRQEPINSHELTLHANATTKINKIIGEIVDKLMSQHAMTLATLLINS